MSTEVEAIFKKRKRKKKGKVINASYGTYGRKAQGFI